MEQEEQYQQPYYPTGMSKGLLQYQLENKQIIADIKHAIKEEEPIRQKDGSLKWVNATGIPPKINDMGVNSIIAKLRSRLTKIFALSDFDDQIIDHFTLALGNNTIEDLRDNWERYEVRSPSAASEIVSLVTENYYAQLRKAKKANYLKLLKNNLTMGETTNFQGEQERRSTFEENRKELPFFSAFFGKRRR